MSGTASHRRTIRPRPRATPRLLVATATAAALALTATACSSGGPSAKTSKVTDTSFTFWSMWKQGEPQAKVLQSAIDQFTNNGADWGALFAGLAMVVLPLLACYVWLGRRIIEGMTVGLVK